MLYRMVSIVCVPWTYHSTGQVGHFLRKDDSCNRTLVIDIALFIYCLLASPLTSKSWWMTGVVVLPSSSSLCLSSTCCLAVKPIMEVVLYLPLTWKHKFRLFFFLAIDYSVISWVFALSLRYSSLQFWLLSLVANAWWREKQWECPPAAKDSQIVKINLCRVSYNFCDIDSGKHS